MDTLHTTLYSLLVAWGVITTILICAMIYRGALQTHEEDQMFLEGAAQVIANEQRAIVQKIEKISKPITVLTILSGTLLVATGAVWAWQIFQNF